MKIAIAGLGYIGAVTAGCFARLGHDVLGADSDRQKADGIAAGRSPSPSQASTSSSPTRSAAVT
jgi:UDP-glucose 6-dehydrogenase